MEISGFKFLNWYKKLHTYILGRLTFDDTCELNCVSIEDMGSVIEFSLFFTVKGIREEVVFTLDSNSLGLVNFKGGTYITDKDFYISNVNFGEILSDVFTCCSNIGVIAHKVEFYGSDRVDLLRIVKPQESYRVFLDVTNLALNLNECNVKISLF